MKAGASARLLRGFAAGVCIAVSLAGHAAPVRVDAVEVELVADATALRAGHPGWIGLRIRHDPHWHTYWRNPGDSGLATTLEVRAPAGFGVGALQWPLPSRFLIASLASYGYEGEQVLPLRIDVPAETVTDRARFQAKAAWLMCREVCIPGEATLSLELPVLAPEAAVPPSMHAALFGRAVAALPAGSLELPVALAGQTLSIELASLVGEATPLPRIEFFPYSESGLRHAAPQRILAAPETPGRAARVALELTDDGRSLLARDSEAARRTLGSGVLLVGNRIVEVVAQPAGEMITDGIELARVEAVAVDLPRQATGLPGAGAWTATAGGARSLPGLGGAGSSPAAGARSVGDAAPEGGGPRVAGAADNPLPLMLVFALIGGMILNLMPCVFPVIGLKVLAFAEHAHDPPATRLVLPAAPGHAARGAALGFAAGVVLSFLALGVLMLALKAAGVSAGWGFQLQSPMFVSAMALLFVAIGLNLAGVFEVGVGLTRLGRFDAAPASTGRVRRLLTSLGSGALAVLVATPCTAPLMASALGFTLSGGPFESLAVFGAIGVGMALPYLLLGWFPGWLRWLPRPGRWMESLRQFLAFPMFATSAWLVWVLGQQAGIDAVFALAIGFVLLALGAWLFGRFVQTRGASRAWLAALAGLASVVGAAWLALHFAAQADGPVTSSAQAGGSAAAPARAGDPDASPVRSGRPAAASAQAATTLDAPSPARWEIWSRQRVEQALAEGRPVFVDFTAAWCVSCQVNKKLVLDRGTVVQEMARRGVLRLRADWTQRDPVIAAELASHGRNGVPLYLLYDSAARAPRVLPELLTVGMVIDALGALASRP